MKNPILFTILLCLSFPCFPQILKSPCGSERWAVKTLTDKDTVKIDFTRIVNSSIAAQVSLQAPKKISKKLPRQPSECIVYAIDCMIIGFKLEKDGDIHLVVSDGDSSMICEIPNPACSEVLQSSHYPQYIALWDYFKANKWNPKPKFRKLKPPVAVSISGVGFFDFIHGQTGVAHNGRELHPVLSLKKK